MSLLVKEFKIYVGLHVLKNTKFSFLFFFIFGMWIAHLTLKIDYSHFFVVIIDMLIHEGYLFFSDMP